MNPAMAIDKLGFRRWYERKLIEAHAYFVTCFLCMIMVAASMESVQLRNLDMSSITMLAAIGIGTWVALHAYKKFRALLVEAERYAEHSVCEHCEAYGLFNVIDSHGRQTDAQRTGEDPLCVLVQCKKCGHKWHLV